jgi:flagellar motility protein MotE (MotC chaperone)
MMPRIHVPRLLPVTIAMLAVVLVSKSVFLVRSAIDSGQPAARIATAWASGPEAAAEIKDGKPAARPGDYGQQIKPSGADKKPEAPGGVDTPPVIEGPPPMTDSEKTVLLELRARRQELDARETALTGRESMLIAAEKKVSARVDELQGLQQRLELLDANHRQQESSAWQGLVKVYETMKPRDAAAIFNDLGMPVLLAVIDRMKEAKAAAVLAAMSPDKARDVTTQLALLRTNMTAETGGKPAPTPEPGKPPRSGT